MKPGEFGGFLRRLFWIAVLITGCSHQFDAQVLKIPVHRQADELCLRLEVGVEVTVETVRLVRNCLAAGGRQPELVALIDEIPDKDLAAWLRFLKNHGALAREWIREGVFEDVIQLLPPLLAQTPLWTRLLRDVMVDRELDREPFYHSVFEVLAQQVAAVDLPQRRNFLARVNQPAAAADSPPATFSDDSRLEQWVHNLECEKPARKNPIHRTYHRGVNNWQKERLQWSVDDLLDHLEPIFDKAADSRQNRVNHTQIEAMLNTLGYFNHRHYQPDDLLRWLHQRSRDARLIGYFYPGDSKPRVRIVNTLDLLELIILHADRKVLLSPNIAMVVLEKVALAWGDEPREEWPVLIKKRFPEGGDLPLKLVDVGRELNHIQTAFENSVGYPRLPSCSKLRTEAGDAADGIVDPIGRLAPRSLQELSFNMRFIAPVYRENSPGASHPNAGGLTLLRDLFFQLWASTPANLSDDDSNLYLVPMLARAGLLRQISRRLKDYPVIIPALRDFYRTFVYASASPALRELFRVLLNTEYNGWPVIHAFTDEVLLFNEQLSQSLFYIMAQLAQFEWQKLPGGVILRERILSFASTLIKHDSVAALGLFRNFLKAASQPQVETITQNFYESTNTEMKDKLTRPLVSVLARPDQVAQFAAWLYQAMEDRELRARFHLALENFQNSDLESRGWKKMQSFFISEQPAALAWRRFLGSCLRAGAIAGCRGAFHRLARFAAEKPERFNRLMFDLRRAIQDGRIKELLTLLRPILSASRPTQSR